VPVFGGILGRFSEKRVDLSEQVEGPVALVVNSRASAVKVAGHSEPVARVTGRVGFQGRVRLSKGVGEKLGPTVAVEARGAKIRVEAPVRALVIVASSSAVRAEDLEVDYVSLRSSHSAIKVSARIKPGGGLLARVTGSGVAVELNPVSPGEYWIEIDASGSTVRIVTPSDSSYLLEEPAPPGVALNVAGKKGGDKLFRVRVSGRGSSISLG